jgi:peptidoglycan hydrolase-like protein with peptidoglycan-binding domain
MKNLIRIIPVLALLIVPVFAHAQTSNTNININDLIAQTQALIARINALKAQQGGVSSATTGGSQAVPGVCPVLTRALSMGSKGTDVSSLQTFLAQDPSVYPEAMVTGYFGPLTEKAVQRWQAKYGVVSSGTPDSTGFGVVGPKTRAAIQSRCSAGAQGGASTGVVGGYIQMTPVSGPVPLSTSITVVVNTAGSCTGGTYTLNFGDNTAPQQVVVPPGVCTQLSQAFTHVYQAAGTYTVVLSSGGHQTTATVTAIGPTAVDSIQASISSSTPLAVTFSGIVISDDAGSCTSNCNDQINFGDGTSVMVPLPPVVAGAKAHTTYSVTHTYATAGNYTVTLTTTPSSGQVKTTANTTVNVTGINPTAPVISMSMSTNNVKQDGVLPMSWTSQNTPVSSAVALWLVNIQSGTIYTLATSLSASGSISVPVSSATGDSTLPPAGLYTVYAKLYTPADAVLTKTTPTYVATAQSGVLTITSISPSSTATSTATSTGATGTYSIGTVTPGVGKNPFAASVELDVPKCPSYTFDWGDDSTPITETASAGCADTAAEKPLSTHAYIASGEYTLTLTPTGKQPITKQVTISGVTATGATTTAQATSTAVKPAATATMTVSVGVTTINQAGSLPITWTSQNAPPSSAVVLWLVNVQSNTFTPLATTLSTNGNVTLPVSGASGGQYQSMASPTSGGTVPPPGTYTVVSKLYTPADALVTGGSATFLATAQASTFTIVAGTSTADRSCECR